MSRAHTFVRFVTPAVGQPFVPGGHFPDVLILQGRSESVLESDASDADTLLHWSLRVLASLSCLVLYVS